MIPTRLHGAIDYAWGTLLILMSFLILAGAARSVAVTFGAIVIAVSLFTDYEWGWCRLIPMPLHLGAEVVAGALLAASPWLLGFADRLWWPHLGFGAFAVVAALLTARVPGDAARRRRTARRHRSPTRR